MRRRVIKDPLPSDHGHHGVGYDNRRPLPRNYDRLVRCPRLKKEQHSVSLAKSSGWVTWFLTQAEKILPER